MSIKYNPISRRMFLQGLGGTLAIPFLPSLLPSSAMADAAVPPMRFVMALGMFGRDITQWYPNVADAQMQTAPGVYYKNLAGISGPLSYILGEEFNPVRSKMNIIRGLDSLQSTGHNSWAPTTACGGWPGSAGSFGYSIDCVLEESNKFYNITPAVGVLRTVAANNGSGQYNPFASWSYTSKSLIGQQIPAKWDATAIYNQLFNPAYISLQAQKAGRIVTATNAIFGNFQQVMKNRRISSYDKYKLDAYMQQLSQIDARNQTVPQACTKAFVPPKTFASNEQLQSTMIDLEIAALSCGITKVCMHSIIHWESNLDLPSDYHSAAHAGASMIAPGGTVSQAAVYNKWMMLRIAEYLTKLDAVMESNGTLLDNTLFIYTNEDSTGSHDHKDLPVIVAGAKAKLRGGYLLDYRPRPIVTPAPYSATTMGIPYNQLLVTAFKALGLAEADYQKFGLKGFGRYDNISPSLINYYQPYISTGVDHPLPFLYLG